MTENPFPSIFSLAPGPVLAAERTIFAGSGGGERYRHFALRDSIVCRTMADGRKHWVARGALLGHLRTDFRVFAMVLDWLEHSGHLASVDAYAESMDAYAQRAGLPDRECGWTDEGLRRIRETEDSMEEAERSRLALQIETAKREFFSWSESSIKDLVRQSIRLVRDEFHLPWPWLALELITEHMHLLLAHVIGCEVVTAIRLVEPDPPAPKITIRLRTRREETVSQLRSRFAERMDRVQRELDQAAAGSALAKGRSPDEETTRRQVAWFYRQRLRGESINKISVTDLYDRTTVRHGVREAERVLSLAAYHYSEGPSWTRRRASR